MLYRLHPRVRCPETIVGAKSGQGCIWGGPVYSRSPAPPHNRDGFPLASGEDRLEVSVPAERETCPFSAALTNEAKLVKLRVR